MHRLLPFFLLIISCSTQAESSENRTAQNFSPPDSLIGFDTLAFGIRLHPTGNYESVKASIRKRMAQGKTSGRDLETYLLNEIIPFWYGTPWDFNGYTAIPNQGEIACGYFVSTTLQHAGLNINRYHLAQQAGLNEAKSLGIDEKNWKWISGKAALMTELKEYADGLYFVGLDNHVGYLLIRNHRYFFIHSNYIEDRVMIEEALSAPAFQSAVYVIAEITTNEELLARWRSGAVVPVVRD